MAKSKGKRSEIAGRLDQLIERLSGEGNDGAVLDRRDDIYYFTGYTGSDAVALFSPRKRKCWLITDSRYLEEAEKTAPEAETVLWRGGFASFVGARIHALGMRSVAYTPSSMTVSFFDQMRGKAAAVTGWSDIDPLIGVLRAVKSRSEIAAVEKALACAQEAFRAAKKRWKIGMTEIEVKNDLEWEMRKRGAEDAAFETIVAAGANASLPHAHAGGRKIAAGKMLLIDFGARVGRYNSDLTRTLWAGDIPKVWLERYRTVLAAQKAGMDAIGSGAECGAPDRAARKVFAEKGLESFFTHSLGHGVGLAIHEEPRLSAKAKDTLQAGNLITIEPGVYFPGSGGIRVEDMVLVEEHGGRVLSCLDKDVDSLIF